jgi:hypothetical protein
MVRAIRGDGDEFACGFERFPTLMGAFVVLRLKCWWARQDLNLGPTDYESAALTS